jgi:pimeloyl-ACP methyl ester carboxylesterase
MKYVYYPGVNAVKSIVFLPGGPSISGEYWDEFISNWITTNKSFNIYRIKLPNHEDNASGLNGVTFTEASTEILKTLLEIQAQNPIEGIVAHSYGAWLALGLLDNDQMNSPLIKLVLVGMPLSTKFANEFQVNKSLLGKLPPVHDNRSFTEYLRILSPLYFNEPALFEELFTKSVSWETSQFMSLSDDRFLESLLNKDCRANVWILNGDRDKLVGNDISTVGYKVLKDAKVQKFSLGSHFFMLEDREIFSKALRLIFYHDTNP